MQEKRWLPPCKPTARSEVAQVWALRSSPSGLNFEPGSGQGTAGLGWAGLGRAGPGRAGQPPPPAPLFSPEPGRQRAPNAAALPGAPGRWLRERRCGEGGSSSRGCARNQGAARRAHTHAHTHTLHTLTHAPHTQLGGRLCSSSPPCTMLRSRQRLPAAP